MSQKNLKEQIGIIVITLENKFCHVSFNYIFTVIYNIYVSAEAEKPSE